MSFWRSKKIISVSSTVYNLAGPEKDRPNFLKSTVFGSAMSNNPDLGLTLNNSYFHGPGLKQRLFFNYAQRNELSTLPEINISSRKPVDRVTIKLYIPNPDNKTLTIKKAFSARGDLEPFVLDWLETNKPDKLNKEWNVEYKNNQFIVQFTNEESYTFTDNRYSPSKDFIAVRYFFTTENTSLIGEEPDYSYEHKSFIYVVGSGIPELDGLVETNDTKNYQEFFPVLPLRINNVSITNEKYADKLYPEIRKAYRRLNANGGINNIIESLEDNESIDDIDYAYVFFGVSLNTKEDSAKIYIKDFYKNLIPYLETSLEDLDVFKAQVAAFNTWKKDYEEGNTTETAPQITDPNFSTFNLTLPKSDLNLDIRIHAISVETEFKLGKFDNKGAPAKKGDIIIEKYQSVDWEDYTESVSDVAGSVSGLFGEKRNNTITSFIIKHQLDNNNYEEVIVWGGSHQNFIYGGKSVDITSTEALDDPEDSGFVIPLHYPTIKEIGLIESTQLATANTLLLINAYTVKKIPWYRRGFFKVILILGGIALAVYLSPASFAEAVGVLGTNASVGASLGLTGVTAIIGGAIANYLAGMVVSLVLLEVGENIFGEEWAAIFASMASFAFSGGIDFNNIFSAENLLKLGNLVGEGYNAYVNYEVNKISKLSTEAKKNYEDSMSKIDELMDSLGGNDLMFDPQTLFKSEDFYYTELEDPQEFLNRATLLGDSVVAMTLASVENFTEHQPTLPR